MEKLVSDMGRRGFDRMRSPRAATMIALASATGHARALRASRNRRGRDGALLDALPDAVGPRIRQAATAARRRSSDQGQRHADCLGAGDLTAYSP
jgi:hypothetical protein